MYPNTYNSPKPPKHSKVMAAIWKSMFFSVDNGSMDAHLRPPRLGQFLPSEGKTIKSEPTIS